MNFQVDNYPEYPITHEVFLRLLDKRVIEVDTGTLYLMDYTGKRLPRQSGFLMIALIPWEIRSMTGRYNKVQFYRVFVRLNDNMDIRPMYEFHGNGDLFY